MKFDEFSLDTEEYFIEHLLDSEENLDLISKFSVPNNALGLEHYLKNSALQDERRDYARTYIVKDKLSGEIVGYFSLRTGLITTQIPGSAEEKFETIPAIELSNFAINSDYKERHPETSKHGFFIFTNFIFPLAKEIKKYVGVNSLYIYALPNERLIGYYKTMGFVRLPPEKEKFLHHHVKPKYDEECIFMYQTMFNKGE